jgi:uncharacterized protein
MISTGRINQRLAHACMVAVFAAGSATAATQPANKPAATVSAAAAPHKKEGARMIDWDALLPENERANYNSAPPAPIHDYLGEGGRAARQTGSIAVNRKLGEAQVKIPGFIVPLVIDASGLVSEFFLVPYFGACIHVPPPPPNQIVYVKLSKGGVRLGSLEDAYWITGTLHTQIGGTSVAKAAYTLDASRMEMYKY